MKLIVEKVSDNEWIAYYEEGDTPIVSGENMIQAFNNFIESLPEHEKFCDAWAKMKSKPTGLNLSEES